MQQLKEEDPHQPVVEEESTHQHGVEVGPVAQGREVLDRQVVDIERLVVALVTRQGERGEFLKIV